MSNGSVNVVEFEGSLADLIRVVQKRVSRATDLISSADDPEIIDREMRFIRPFWDFATTRRTLNSSRYWAKLQTDLFRSHDNPVRKTALMWCPDRTAVCQAAGQLDQRSEPQLIQLLFGVDLVIFNFTRLLGRMKNTFGIEDPESFEITTREAHQGRGYVFRNRCIIRRSASGSTYRILTSLFGQPDGEEIKIEKDYSQSLTDPEMELRVQQHSNDAGRRSHVLQYAGSHSEMKRRSGVIRVR